MSFGERLKARRRELQLTQSALGKEIGVSGAAISQLEKGDTKGAKGENLFALAKALKCSPEWLLKGDGKLDSEGVVVQPGPPVTGVYPLVTWQQLIDADSIASIDTQSAETYPSITPCSEKTIILPVAGISMSPKFEEGDLIFVDPNKEVKHGSFVVARHEQDVIFRQLVTEGSRLYLKAVNPDWPEPLLKTTPENILGVIVFSVTLV